MPFEFNPEAPVAPAFKQNAPAGNAITAQQLMDTPSSEWGNLIKNSDPPSDMATFRGNLDNELKISSRVNKMGLIGKIAIGRFDRAIDSKGIDDFAEDKISYRVNLEDYKALHREVYKEAYNLRLRSKSGELSGRQLKQGIKELTEYKDQKLGDVTDNYRSKISEAMDKIKNTELQQQQPEQTPEAAPEINQPSLPRVIEI